MSHTTDKMRETAGKIARIISEKGKEFGCSECIVDDFGRFGNFSLILYLNVRKSGRFYKPNDKISLIRLVNIIKTIIKEEKESGAIYRSHECPQGMYSQQRIRSFTESYFEGYEREYIQIDLDFIPYHAPSNTFAVQTEPVIVEQNPRGQQLNLF
jgi:hypothetical protein